jgi:two-component system phosphate regulon response regulator PhoB
MVVGNREKSRNKVVIMADDLTPSVLIIEDEEAIIIMLRYNLERNGFLVHSSSDGENAFALVQEMKPDIILLDWMLPGCTGIEICNQLRANDETRAIPIIMLTAKGEEADRVKGLDSGADDYIVKPFSPTELISRIRAVFRRMRTAFSGKILNFGDVSMDLSTYKVIRNGMEVHLGPTEFRILQCLLEYPKRIFSRETLLTQVWGYNSDIELRTVDVHINRLRSALRLNDDDTSPFIWTIRSAGYCLQRSSD